MILSFFVFLVISLSMFFGLTSYIIGFRNELPNEVFQTQKYTIGYNTWALRYHGNTNTDEIKVNDNAVEALKSEIKDLDADPVYQDDSFINKLISGYGGNINEYVINEYNKNKKTINGPIGYLEAVSLWNKSIEVNKNSGLLATAISNRILKKNFSSSYTFSRSVCDQSSASRTVNDTYFLHVKGDSDDDLNTSSTIYETKKYIHRDNVVFLSPKAENERHLKLGQDVTITIQDSLTNKDFSQVFVYGGKASDNNTLAVAKSANTRYYFLNNYVPTSEVNFARDIVDFSQMQFNFRIANDKGSKSEAQSHWEDIAYGDQGWLKPTKNGDKTEGFYYNDHLYVVNLIFTAMMMLVIVFDIIMLLLDIVIAWFLIKEIIRSLSKELLFLKTLGMTNHESSLTTSMTLLIILGGALCLGLVGMLGIQYLFISLTNHFVDDYNSWSSIQPLSLIAIFGSVAFLFAAYFAVSEFVIKHMRLTDNNIVNKSEFRFKNFTNWMFNRDINSGITLAFTIKNLNKIIVTFLISFLISMLCFISLGFKTSINDNTRAKKSIILHKDNLTYLDKTPQYVYNSSDGSITSSVKFSDEKLTEENHLGDDKKLTGKFLYRNDIEKILSDPSVPLPNSIKNEFNEFCKSYDAELDAAWPNADHNFAIDFGTMFVGGTYKETTFNYFCRWDENITSQGRLIVLNKNDSRYKKIFSDNKEHFSVNGNNNPIIPVTVSPRMLSNRNLNVGDYSKPGSKVDFGIDGLTPDSNLTVHYVSAREDLSYVDDMYVKQDDFINYLDYLNKKIPSLNSFWNNLIASLENNTSNNSFMDNGLPIGLKQFVIPSAYVSGNKVKQLNSLFDYMMFIKNKGIEQPGLHLYSKWMKINNSAYDPLITTMLVILVLSLVLVLSFIIFMVMTIMSENDEIIFIMKALGYEKREILWRIISGYLCSIILSVVLGIGIGAVILNVLSPTFFKILFLTLKITASGPILGLFFALIAAMCLFVLGISSYKINKRNLTVREE